jgi:spore maturation protein CgeB
MNTGLPATYSFEILEKNLRALAKVEPLLVTRISWPVDSSHVSFRDNGQVDYHLDQSNYPLTIPKRERGLLLRDLDWEKVVFIFGIGLGEPMEILVRGLPDGKIIAWEKDPWLLRLSLMRRDYSEVLSSGRLKLLLSVDLIGESISRDEQTIVYHPLLRAVYRNDEKLLFSGITKKRVLMNAGGLFVDDVAEAFREFGYTPLLLNLGGVSIEEIEYTIMRCRPSLLFSINYQNGLAELCSRFSMGLLCWEVDPSIDCPAKLPQKNKQAYIFTYRRKNRNDFVRAGFDNVYYMPLAADVNKRKPVMIMEEEKGRYGASLSFVGSSLLNQAKTYKKKLTKAYEKYRRLGSVDSVCHEDSVLQILREQSRDYSNYRIPKLAHEFLGGFIEYFSQEPSAQGDPVKMLAESAASKKRLAYLSRLGAFGIKVWGDEGFKETEAYGAVYMGFAGHKHEINKIYSGSQINLDISRIYQMDMVNMRLFDIMACGGFVLAEYSEELEELFELDQEVVAYRTLDELVEKIEYYLTNEEQRREIAHRGMMAVKLRHTIEKRVEEMLRLSGNE